MPLAQAMEPVEPAPSPEAAVAPAQEQFSVQVLIDQNELPALEAGTLDLSNKGLTSLVGLENVPNADQVLDLLLDENKIVYIQPHAFDHFINLQNLNLTNNPIIQIEPGLFDRLVNLEQLHLEGTSIIEIPPHAFDNLRMLKVLHLFDNKLESLPANCLDNLRLLKELAIENNNLIALDAALLKNQLLLEQLYLDKNNLTQLPKITHLSHLKELHLKNNPNLSELSPEEVAFILQHHVYVDATEVLGEIPPYSVGQLIADLGDNWGNTLLVPSADFPGWFDLVLDNKGLTDLSGVPSFFNTLPIYKISLKNNFIKKIPFEFLLDPITNKQLFYNLYVLDLSNNMLEELSVTRPLPGASVTEPLQFAKYCPYLNTINLENNRLKYLLKGTFNKLRFLIELNLSHNQISNIQDGLFDSLGNLEDLQLQNNKLHIFPTTIFKNLHKLKYLDLIHNSLGNKEQYVFPSKAQIEFYPQEIPMLKLLAAKKLAAQLEAKDLIQVYKILQTIPEELHDAIYTAASKNVAKKIYFANKIKWLFNLIENKPILLQSYVVNMWPKEMNEAMLAVAPENLRNKLIGIGFGSKIPTVGGQRGKQPVERAEEPQEESEEETFEFMNDPGSI